MFDIMIEQKVLMKALEYLEPTVGKNVSNLGENCLSMKINSNCTSIEMYTTNTVEFTKLEAIITLGSAGGDVAPYVDFKRFKKIISAIPDTEHVSIKCNGNDLLINFSGKKNPVKLNGCNTGILALPVFNASNTVITLPKNNVKSALDGICSILEDNSAKPIYNCFQIETDGNGAVVFTAFDITNNRNYIKKDYGIPNAASKILVEASKLKKSMKIFEDFNEMDFCMNNSIVGIEASDPVSSYSQKTAGMIINICYYARNITGTYPAIASNFYPLPLNFIEINKDDMMRAIGIVQAIEEKTSSGLINFEYDGSFVSTSYSSSYGEINDSFAAENAAPISISTGFKYKLLSDIIKAIPKDEKENVFEIGQLPNHPSYFVVRPKNNSDEMYILPGVASNNNTNVPNNTNTP